MSSGATTQGTTSFFPPLVVGGVLYGGSVVGHLYALDARTGEELWRFSTGAAKTPALVDGVVYFGARGRNLIFGVDAGSGEELWRRETESGAMRFLTVDEGVIYASYYSGDVNAYLPRIER